MNFSQEFSDIVFDGIPEQVSKVIDAVKEAPKTNDTVPESNTKIQS